MTYKLFIWKIGDKYLAVFPEVDVEMIAHGPDKEKVKDELIKRITTYLKTLDKYPENKNIKDILEILEVLPQESLISTSGINF